MLLAHRRLAAVAALTLGCSTDGMSYWEGWPRSSPPACDAGASACGRACVDLQADPRNCGACERACATNERCIAGSCACPAGSARCRGTTCASLLSDRAHCGACGNACASGASCVQGACRCSGDTVLCDGRCVAALTDVAHCGACARRCPSGASCVWGTCQPTCPAGTATCDPSATTPCLTNVLTSAEHCGACGRRCGTGSTCSAGRCVCASPPCPVATCEGPCGAGEFCAMGVCVCPPGQSRCGGRCVDLRGDRSHCGACGGPCGPEEDCAEGRCAPREGPRLLTPPSGAVVATARPTFRWLAGSGEVSWRVTLCRDRACAQPVATLDTTETSTVPASDLTAAVYFWRVTARRADGSDGPTSPTWALRVGARRGVGGGLIGHFIDVNGDGYADHVRVDTSSSRVCLLAGSPTGLRAGVCPVFVDASGVALRFSAAVAPGDFDGDGFTDVAVFGANRPQVRVFVLRGGPAGLSLAGSFGEGADAWRTSGSDRVAHGVGDLDDDGYADLTLSTTVGAVPVVSLHVGGRALPTWLPRRVLSAPEGVTSPHGGGVANVGDVDRDGRADLVVVSRVLSGVVRVLTYQPGAEGLPAAPTWSSVSETRAFSAAEGGDFDGDGAADLLLKNDRSLWFVRGGGPLGSPQLIANVPSPTLSPLATTFAGARDLDGDGRSDFLAVSAASAVRTLRMHRGTPLGLSPSPSSEASIDATTSTPAAVWLGDVNRDGFDDVGVTLTTEILVYHGRADGLPDHPTQRVVLRGPDP